MQCFGGLFRPRVVHRSAGSIADAPGPALSTSEEASAATCSPAACAQSAQQHCTETCQQHATVASTSAELLSALPCEPPFPFLNGSTVADQQAQAAQAVPVPAAVASSMNGFAAAHQHAYDFSTTARPRQPAVLAEPVLLSAPPLTAAQTSKGRQTRSAMAMEAFTAASCSTAPSASLFASSQAGLKPATLPGNQMSRQNSRQGGGVHPGHLQHQGSDPLSKQASLERRDSCPGLMATEANFSWDYIQPRAGGKDFLGQRKKDIRGSLDWDFQNEMPMAVTRRSKEYGEERPRTPLGGLDTGRSYSGSMTDNSSLV